ncbi:tetratricopeptide repeat protein [Thermoclostridium caenicola]|uniref:Tetratricopeptide repeat-containing protein n=1 Tax=Thermoclostridium caenicola TaxID=659425 RepID=A0A1M6ISU5_9FIRM|nr:tetratricopeptide repeat protein [Thermoclostridium caenicola]SHJ37543.1 Tetratricopeptide repeat-containing protein [Thermoclostridium caenicola]
MDNLQVQEYLTQGAVLAGQGKHEEALAYYDKAEKENPMNIDVYLSKGIALANLDRLDEAKQQFEKALKVNRTSGLAYFHLGNIAVLQGNIALGFENYNKAIANGFDDAQVYYSIGLLHEEKGEIDMAIRNYSKAIMRDPLRPDIRIRKARLLLQGNHFPEALQTLDEMILTNPDVFEGYHLKFSVLMQLKQYDKAEEVLNTALNLFPKDPGFIIDKANLLIERKKFDEALAVLAELENAEETDDAVRRRIYMERAQIYASREDVRSAIAALEQAKALSEKAGEFDTEVIFLLANCHLSTEEYEKVLGYAQELLEKAEDGYQKETARYFEPFALKMLGRMDEALPKYKDAINEYRNQALAAPGNLDAYLLRTMCLRDIGQYDKALELIDYVITLQPDRAEPRLLRVSILEALGRNEEAAEEAKTVNTMLPEELRKK